MLDLCAAHVGFRVCVVFLVGASVECWLQVTLLQLCLTTFLKDGQQQIGATDGLHERAIIAIVVSFFGLGASQPT